MKTKNGWQKVYVNHLIKTFRPGWMGVWDHALSVIKKRQGPYRLTDMELSFYVKGNPKKIRAEMIQLNF